jgi:nicotinate-nucleotide--dimethylbenzimidazole phosphoribosyltransferase
VLTETNTLQPFLLPAVAPLSGALDAALQRSIDTKTKPPGALGLIEVLAHRLGAIQQTLTPTVTQPTIVVFAADHGISVEGVSPYPHEVTAQMVANFLAGGAAINVFAELNSITLRIVNAGVATPIPGAAQPQDASVAPGTANMLHASAMSEAQLNDALSRGASIVREISASDCNVIGFGEMGIGNTSSAALLMHLLADVPLAHCTGRGTGLDDAGLAKKLALLQQVAARARTVLPANTTAAPRGVLRECGGFEIAMMVGAILRAGHDGMCIVIDGFIASAALLAARALRPAVIDYCVFAHQSDEAGHALMLQHMGATPLLALGMRLGEGTGAALAIPLLRAATTFLCNMASFESAGVSDRSDD